MPTQRNRSMPDELCAHGGGGGCSRRTILAAGIGLVGSAFVAACSSGAHTRLAGSAAAPGGGSSAVSGPGSTPPRSADPTLSATSSTAAATSKPAPATTSASSASRTDVPTDHPTTTRPAPPTPTAPAATHSTTKPPPPSPSVAPSTGHTGTVLTTLSAVPVGGSLVVSGPHGPIAIGRPGANRVVAHTAICTHQGCTVEAAGAQLACPCHGSVFDAFSGAVVHDPAPSPLASISVRIEGADIVTP